MTTPERGRGSCPPAGDDASFSEFLGQIRAGDEWAAAELVQRYEPALRLEIKLRLNDPKLRRLLEPADVCQSVLKSFFLRAAVGQFELDSYEKLLGLLLTMARNKVADQVRMQQALRRDHRRDVSLADGELLIAADDPSPSRTIIGREELNAFRERLSLEERRMADLRSQGWEWSEIAAEIGGSPQARRKQLARAIDRVADELGLDEAVDETE
jgi:RNA polymerase sigma factor (sigma-70 family)